MKHSFLSLTTVLMVALSGVTSFVNAQTVTKMRIWQQGQVQWIANVQDVDSITFVETGITSIALNKTEVTLAEGSTIKLIASANDGLEGSYSWMSSNEEVATVDTYGIVTAVKKGTATITVTETTTNLTATCKVSVVSELETLEFTQATVAFYNRSEYLATLDTVDSIFSFTDNTGERHYLRGFLVDVDVNIYSDGLYINDNGDMDGATVGYIAHFPGKAYYAPAGMNDDRGYEDAAFVSMGVWSTESNHTNHKLMGGYIEDRAGAFEHLKTAFNYHNNGGDDWYDDYGKEMQSVSEAFQGGTLWRYEYSPDYGYYNTTYIPSAIVTKCNMQLKWNESSKYMYSVPAIEMEMTPLGGDYGLGVEIEINEITNEWKLMSNDFIFEPVITYKRITENAPARDKNLFPVLPTQKDLQHKVLTAQPKNVRRTAMPLR